MLELREMLQGQSLGPFGPRQLSESASLQMSGLVWSGRGSFGYGLAEQGTQPEF